MQHADKSKNSQYSSFFMHISISNIIQLTKTLHGNGLRKMLKSLQL